MVLLTNNNNTPLSLLYIPCIYYATINFSLQCYLNFSLSEKEMQRSCDKEQTGSFFNNCSLNFQMNGKRSQIILKNCQKVPYNMDSRCQFYFITDLLIAKQKFLLVLSKMCFALLIDFSHSVSRMSHGLAQFKGLCDLRMSTASHFKVGFFLMWLAGCSYSMFHYCPKLKQLHRCKL